MVDSSTNHMTPPTNLVQALRKVPGTYHPGWEGPEYTSWKDKQMSWKQTCYIGDWSFLYNLIVKGSDALKYGQEIYDAIIEAGKEFGIRRLGRRTAMIKHLEACFPTG